MGTPMQHGEERGQGAVVVCVGVGWGVVVLTNGKRESTHSNPLAAR
jgi:hypothetical protein